ncbi:31395_t:CDS:2, partial [Gigaspora margarita]
IDYQPDKIRLDIEIKGLFQKKEQEIVGILEKFKNRVLKKDKAVTKCLEVQHPNKVTNQAQIAKDTLLQLECGTHDYGTKELQATTNRNISAYQPCKRKLEAKELQEKIVRINRTTRLLERESPTDIEMSEKEEVSPIIADFTNEVEVMQDSLQSMSIQEENKKSLSMKLGYLTHNKAREDISASRWAPRNRVKLTSTNQTQDLPEDARVQKIRKCLYTYGKATILGYQRIRNNKAACIEIQSREEYNPNKENFFEIEPPIKTGHSNTRERIYKKQHEWSILHQKRGRSLPKLDLMKHNRDSFPNKQENTKTPCDMNNTGSLPERKLLKEILERLSNLEGKQVTTTN